MIKIHTPVNKIKRLNKLLQPSKLPERTVFIETKNGKSYVKDEFVGMHVQRPSIMSVINEIVEKLVSKFVD